MKYELVIFDMDGTILNTLEDLKDACNYALDRCGYPVRDIEEVKFFVGNGIRKLLERALPETSTAKEVDRVQEVFTPYYQEHSADKTGPYLGIKELLTNLKAAGCINAVVSNKPDLAVKKLAEEYFPGLFDIAIGENEAAGVRKKPSPDEVNLVLKAFPIDKSRAVYIGDSDVDVATAANSGLDLIAVDWGFRSHEFLVEHGAEVICSDPKDVEHIILAP